MFEADVKLYKSWHRFMTLLLNVTFNAMVDPYT